MKGRKEGEIFLPKFYLAAEKRNLAMYHCRQAKAVPSPFYSQ